MSDLMVLDSQRDDGDQALIWRLVSKKRSGFLGLNWHAECTNSLSVSVAFRDPTKNSLSDDGENDGKIK